MTLSCPLAKEACPTAGGILMCKGVPIMVQYIAMPEMIQNPTCSVMQKLQTTRPCQNHFLKKWKNTIGSCENPDGCLDVLHNFEHEPYFSHSSRASQRQNPRIPEHWLHHARQLHLRVVLKTWGKTLRFYMASKGGLKKRSIQCDLGEPTVWRSPKLFLGLVAIQHLSPGSTTQQCQGI